MSLISDALLLFWTGMFEALPLLQNQERQREVLQADWLRNKQFVVGFGQWMRRGAAGGTRCIVKGVEGHKVAHGLV